MTDRRKEILTAYLFLLPNFIGFLVFTSGPVIASLYLAFTRWDLFHAPRWAGLQNFVSLLGFSRSPDDYINLLGLFRVHYDPNDPFFWQYLYNTAYMMLAIPFTLFGSLLLAIALSGVIALSQMVIIATGQMNLSVGAIGGFAAISFSGLMEVFHMLLTLAIARPFDAALTVVERVYIPMILANAIGMYVFSVMVENVQKERELRVERDTLVREKGP